MEKWLGFIWPNSQKARIFLAILALVLIAGVVGMARIKKQQAAPKKAGASLALREAELKNLNQDSDNDGLKDWEETIFRTDPRNPDTDGDGTKDGEEIKLARDPLQKGPDDGIATSTLLKNYSPYFAPDNLTGRLAEKFGAEVIVPRLSGSSRPLDLESIGDQIITETLSETRPRQNFFTAKDVKTSKDNSAQALENYGNALIDAISVFSSITRSPLEIFSDALAKDDLASLKSLDPYLTAYGKMLEKMRGVKTPSSLVSFHYQYMNLVSAQKEAIGKIRNAENDIVSAIVGAQEFTSNFQEITSLMKNLAYVAPQ